MSDEVMKYPTWRHAAEVIAADPPPPGMVLTKQYLADLMGIALPTPEMPHGAAQKLELVALTHFTELRAWLGKNYQIRIEARGQDGYEILAPGDQIPASVRRREKEIRRAIRHLRAEVSWTPMDQLTDEQRKEAVDALARMGRIGNQLQRRKPDRWLPPPSVE